MGWGVGNWDPNGQKEGSAGKRQGGVSLSKYTASIFFPNSSRGFLTIASLSHGY